VNTAASTDLPDAASGFRAYSRDSLMLLNTITRFSYCMETIIQAGNKKLAIESIPIRTNPKTRESRLFSSTYQHVLKSAGAIVRAYIMYKPYVIFSVFAALFGVLGLDPVRALRVPQGVGDEGNHLQSLLVGTVLLVMSFMSVIVGIIGDLLRTNRALIEDTLEHTKKLRFGQLDPTSPAPVDVSERAVPWGSGPAASRSAAAPGRRVRARGRGSGAPSEPREDDLLAAAPAGAVTPGRQTPSRYRASPKLSAPRSSRSSSASVRPASSPAAWATSQRWTSMSQT
jgi:hypothetical protein